MEKIWNEILENISVRNNLSQLRQMIKEETCAKKLAPLVKKEMQKVLALLKNEDAKTRRNAALLLGDLQCEEARDAIFEAYEKEDTLFVKGSYLTALSKLNMEDKIGQLKEILDSLLKIELTEDNRKHVEEEIRALRNILIQYEGICRHTFACKDKKAAVILLVPKNLRETVKRSITCGRAALHPLGVLVETEDLLALMQLRTYKEMLFPVKGENGQTPFLSSHPIEAAEQLWNTDLMELLKSFHKEEGPFFYRVECKSAMTLEQRSSFTKKFCSHLEGLSHGMLINSTGDYEVEIRLIVNKEGLFFPAVKLYTMKQKRFAYRKDFVAASIQPFMAALIMEVAESYLKENAQILDPFCGVGTMLIERDIKVPAREIYAIDTFQEAIEKGRRNANLAGEKINFINRNFFDFIHEYKFDEIVTNMPTRGKKTQEEMDTFYYEFFKKAEEVLAEDAVVIMYTNEASLARKNRRKNGKYELLEEMCILPKTEYYVMIMRYKGF